MISSQAQKPVFKKILLASVTNIVGFGLAVWAIGYLAVELGLRNMALLLAAIVILIILTTINALVLFTFYTLKSIPATMEDKTAELSFADIYGYTLAGIAVRLVESAAYVYYMIYLYKIFF
jgi:hypothetical protein